MNLTLTSLSQQVDNLWKPIHLILVKQQKPLIWLFVFFEFLVGLGVPAAATFFFFNSPSIYALFREVGGKFGTVAVLLFLTTLVPGMLKRFQLLPLVSSSLVLFRRHIGILSFMFMITHGLLSLTLPLLLRNTFSFSLLSQRAIYGVAAEVLLLPLWITSNDFSVERLGPSWKWVQRLSYVAYFFILFHVALQETSLGFVIAVAGMVEIASWIYKWTKKKPTAVPLSPAPPTSTPTPMNQ